MKKGEHALVTVPAKHGFGDQDSQQPLALVPAGSTLSYDVTLVDFTNVR